MIKLIEKIAYWLDRKFSKKESISEEDARYLLFNPFTVDEYGNLTTTKFEVDQITVSPIEIDKLICANDCWCEELQQGVDNIDPIKE